MGFEKLMLRGAIAGAVCALAGGALAEDINCLEPMTQRDMLYCADQAYKAADGDLNFDYQTARDYFRRVDSDLPKNMRGAADALLEAQRAWIPYRDAACRTEGFMARGGSMEPLIVTMCLENLTRQRSEDLRALVEQN
ncbi:MAG: lysozyme inhibitor LprI family protein [Paracoccaceae bacterium]